MLEIYLEAKEPLLNRSRTYSIELSQNLFNEWSVKITYGRTGSQGHHKIYLFKTIEEAVLKIKSILTRRASAPQRSGCQYRLIDHDQDPSLSCFEILERFRVSSSEATQASLKSKAPVSISLSPLPLFEGQDLTLIQLKDQGFCMRKSQMRDLS